MLVSLSLGEFAADDGVSASDVRAVPGTAGCVRENLGCLDRSEAVASDQLDQLEHRAAAGLDVANG